MAASMPLKRSDRMALRMQNRPLTTVVPDTSRSGRTTQKPSFNVTQNDCRSSFHTANNDTISPAAILHCAQIDCKWQAIGLHALLIDCLLLRGTSSDPWIISAFNWPLKWQSLIVHRFHDVRSKKSFLLVVFSTFGSIIEKSASSNSPKSIPSSRLSQPFDVFMIFGLFIISNSLSSFLLFNTFILMKQLEYPHKFYLQFTKNEINYLTRSEQNVQRYWVIIARQKKIFFYEYGVFTNVYVLFVKCHGERMK